MVKPQISIRLAPALLERLNRYIERTGRSKTEIIITALSGYLGANDGDDLGNRLTRLEENMADLLTTVKDLKEEQN
ncbi:ribbon-helix-helix protein, CopG family [Gloeothece verrucosa]|uniref:CopG domain protein DNA-binding domain protein n=1 Tax=Gloeothece verrucosa (strain PCC 7822) TaxID=497965 RepID=E0U7A9_GLOV7|nr:ribbon-helix-helix protein, CopG family [Gloeothece verrucosa]ADN12496.1 CopG domain protein DNA-binding domain protein [Gloeothece verrucosa PCC 7822]